MSNTIKFFLCEDDDDEDEDEGDDDNDDDDGLESPSCTSKPLLVIRHSWDFLKGSWWKGKWGW